MDCSPPGSSCPWEFPGKNTGVFFTFTFTFPSPGDLPGPGIELECPASAGGFFTTEPPRKLP